MVSGSRNPRKVIAVATVALPAISSIGRSGVTKSCSSVPRSGSRRMAMPGQHGDHAGNGGSHLGRDLDVLLAQILVEPDAGPGIDELRFLER